MNFDFTRKRLAARALMVTIVCAAGAPFTLNAGAILPLPGPVVASTVPANGDQNPYGVVFVGPDFRPGGALNNGDILVSNFNNSVTAGNLQGTGTTIVKIDPAGQTSLFYQAPAGLGLTTALGLLKAGFVIVGNMPAPAGTCASATAGSLLFLDKNGNLAGQTGNNPAKLDGPWDLTINDNGNTAQVFISNVLSGNVVRFDLAVSYTGIAIQKATVIGSGYSHRCDAAALVVGPTGLAYDRGRDILYVASTEDNVVYSIPAAGSRTTDDGTGAVIYSDGTHLHGPLGMVLAPNGDLIVSNSDVINPDPNQTSELVEFTTSGQFVSELSLDGNPGGSFGLAFSQVVNGQVRFAAVDDNVPNLTIWNLRFP